MSINPLATAEKIGDRFRRYLETSFPFPDAHADLREQFAAWLRRPGWLLRGPYLHGLAPYETGVTAQELIRTGVLPPQAAALPLLPPDRPLYRHQVAAIERLRDGNNVIVSSGTGSGKTLTFLAPVLSRILEDPQPGVHALLLYPLNALVNDQLKNLRRILKNTPGVTFGRYINSEVTPQKETDARRLHKDALDHEVVSREVFRRRPPHILITNYSMLEYLLMRADDSPLFDGPWRFVVVDEAHSYAGTKGGEVALLLRRLTARVKRPGDKPPQYVATSASLGTDDAARRREVLDFANNLFNAPFADADLISAERKHAPAAGGVAPDPDVYRHPAVEAACEPGGGWTPALAAALTAAGFPAEAVAAGAATASTEEAARIEEALYAVFETDQRVHELREQVKEARGLEAVAKSIFGTDGSADRERLIGLVRVCNRAKVPGGLARLVPCRYHLFTRGLDGATVALEPKTGRPDLFLDPVTETEDGRRALELRVCRKCGQPYLVAARITGSEADTLSPSPTDGPATVWLTWTPPTQQSDDEADEANDHPPDHPPYGFDPKTGRFRPLGDAAPTSGEARVWLVGEEPELNTCTGCGGKKTVTAVRADADAAQAVIADALYRELPKAQAQPAADYPGRGRKLLTFADGRQSAAYFAPYLENTNREQLARRLVYQATDEAFRSLGEPVDADTLIGRMVRLADRDGLFPPTEAAGEIRGRCAKAVVTEFCLPFSRRQSLEALALVACAVDLSRAWRPPAALLDWLSLEEADCVAQVLLASVRQQKAVAMPDEVAPTDPAFKYREGHDAVVADGSEAKAGKYRLHGFSPKVPPKRQRRSHYLLHVLAAAARRCNQAAPADPVPVLDAIWQALIGATFPALASETVAPGKVGHQLRWQALRFRPGGDWFVCDRCRQWSAVNVLGVCPSFGCAGTLSPADPDAVLAGHHYRCMYRLAAEAPVPLAAKEHTAQLGPKLATEYQHAFQDGHQPDHGQINVLSSSTTFELGVDLGDLEAVLLRNVPPSPANYQQRAGRAGRGVGTAAFAVTFALPRSHDRHYFANPPAIIDGEVRPPRADLRNETIYLRHVTAVLLAEFIRGCPAGLRTVADLLPGGAADAPLDRFVGGLEAAIRRSEAALRVLVPNGRIDPPDMARKIAELVAAAREHYAGEARMYEEAIDQAQADEAAANAAGDTAQARRHSGRRYMLAGRLDQFRDQDWVGYLSDRCVLPSYAFPIHNVSLATTDPGLKLERDLRLALSEFVPGCKAVARGKLWESVGVRLPWQKSLKEMHYARCPRCWHVMTNLDRTKVFPTGLCPVCGDDGTAQPRRTTHRYRVPEYGFTTDLTTKGDSLDYDKPLRQYASRVMFVPQQKGDDPVRCHLGGGADGVAVYTTDPADFFVFNDGSDVDPSRRGFPLCKLCGLMVKLKESGGKRNRTTKVEPHRTPFGRDCPGTGYDHVHLGHDFRSSAARLRFTGTGRGHDDHAFWQSLLYTVLRGLTDALGVDPQDVNGVIRAVGAGGAVGQEVVVFDDVPGGAGHALRLEGADELHAVLTAAHARVANCTCGETTSCYTCLRSYRNQFCHDALARGPVADYLGRLLQAADADPRADRPYSPPDRAAALRAAIDTASQLDVVAERLDATGPPESGPWYLKLQEAATRPGAVVRVAIRTVSGSTTHLLALGQAGADLRLVRDGAPPPEYAVLAGGLRPTGFHWGEARTAPFDQELHRRPLWVNRSAARLAEAATASDAWFAAHTIPLPATELAQAAPGSQAYPFRKGQPVDLRPVFAGLEGRQVIECRLQDPYLLTAHQMDALSAFLAAVAWPAGVPFRLHTHMTENDPSKRDQLSPDRQRAEIERRVKAAGPALELRLHHPRYSRLHMRYAYVRLADGERLYLLERGLDLADPRTGKAFADSYILEFTTVPPELKQAMGLPG